MVERRLNGKPRTNLRSGDLDPRRGNACSYTTPHGAVPYEASLVARSLASRWGACFLASPWWVPCCALILLLVSKRPSLSNRVPTTVWASFGPFLSFLELGPSVKTTDWTLSLLPHLTQSRGGKDKQRGHARSGCPQRPQVGALVLHQLCEWRLPLGARPGIQGPRWWLLAL